MVQASSDESSGKSQPEMPGLASAALNELLRTGAKLGANHSHISYTSKEEYSEDDPATAVITTSSCISFTFHSQPSKVVNAAGFVHNDINPLPPNSAPASPTMSVISVSDSSLSLETLSVTDSPTLVAPIAAVASLPDTVAVPQVPAPPVAPPPPQPNHEMVTATASERWYCVTVGREVGVFNGWHNVASLVIGVPHATYFRLPGRLAAHNAFEDALNSNFVRRV